MFFLHFSFASYNAWFNATLILPSENLVTIVEKFLDHNKRKLRQQRQRRQRERQKSNEFIVAKQQLCTRITLFCTFLAIAARLQHETS